MYNHCKIKIWLLGYFLITITQLNPLPAQASCLTPIQKLSIPENFFTCAADTDCTIAGDACRSCGNYVAINKKFLADFNKIDTADRIKNKCVLTCEACATQHLKAQCQKGRCQPPAESQI